MSKAMGVNYKNIQIHNAAEISYSQDGKSISWRRVPSNVGEKLTEGGQNAILNATGIELRFVMNSDEVEIELEALPNSVSIFHVYRGSIQGGWKDHEVGKCVIGKTNCLISKPKNLPTLRKISEDAGYPFAPEVVRIIFDRGLCRICNIEGDIEPPKPEQLPKKTLMAYGSSITHGSNALDGSSKWVSVLAHKLNMDYRNLGMPGSCAMEPELVDYIAREGECGKWDTAILELGVNVLQWEDKKIHEHVSNTIRQIAGRNSDKMVFVVSPLYCNDDFYGRGNAERWRRIIAETVEKEALPNVKLINGLDLIGDMSMISADEVHPNIYGIRQITERLYNIIMSQQIL